MKKISKLFKIRRNLAYLLLMVLSVGSNRFKPRSRKGRKSIEFWLSVSKFARDRASHRCNQYYDNRHPQHYMWLGHNQYLYDNVNEGDRVLDVGCASSYYPQWLAEKAESVVGVDILPERIALSRENNSKENVSFELMDVTQEMPKGQFDVVVCSHVIEHLDDPVAVLDNLAHHVPRILVKVPLIDTDWVKMVKRDIGMFWMDTTDHRREYTAELLRQQLEDSGWEVEEIIRGYDLRAKAKSTYLA